MGKEASAKLDRSNGYLYFIDKSHPLASKVGKVYVHRHAAMQSIGRLLKSEEYVHHKDGNKTNNDPSNLEILSSKDHGKIHMPVVKEKNCKGCGLLFKPKDNRRQYCSTLCSDEIYNRSKKPPEEILRSLIEKHSITAIAAQFGVSRTSVTRWKKSLIVISPSSSIVE